MTATIHAFRLHAPLIVITLGLALAIAEPAMAEKKRAPGTSGTAADCASSEAACNAKCKVDNPKSQTGAALCTAGCGSARVICDLAHPKAARAGAGARSPDQPLLKSN